MLFNAHTSRSGFKECAKVQCQTAGPLKAAPVGVVSHQWKQPIYLTWPAWNMHTDWSTHKRMKYSVYYTASVSTNYTVRSTQSVKAHTHKHTCPSKYTKNTDKKSDILACALTSIRTYLLAICSPTPTIQVHFSLQWRTVAHLFLTTQATSG